VGDRRAHGVMVDAEGRGDGADLPVLAVIEPSDLGVLLGRDHGASPPRTRDGPARAVVGARRFPGRRPCIATHPLRARSAPDPSPCPPAVWPGPRPAGKCDPSRGRDRHADDHDDRGALPDSVDGAGAPRRPMRAAPPCDTPASNTRDRDHTRGRSRRVDCSVGTLSGEAARPRRRSSGVLRLDTARKPWQNRDDWLGSSEHRGGHRGSGDISSRPSPRPRRPQLTVSTDTKRLWTLTHPWTHRTRPPLLGNLAEEREIPTSVHSPSLFLRRNKDEEPTTTVVQIYAISGER
jgi:hypothetical protein